MCVLINLLAGPVDIAGMGVGEPSLGVSLDLCHAPSIGLAEAFQSGSVMEDPGGMAGTVWLVERLSVCEMLLIVWRWICSTHAGSGLCGCCGDVVECH